GSTETGGLGDGENKNAQWPTLRRVSQKAKKVVTNQSECTRLTNRRGLHDGGELGGAIGADHPAERHQTRGDDAVEGRLDLRIAEVERGLCNIDLGLLEPGARRIAIGRCIVERLLRGDLAARKVGLALIFSFRLLQRRLRGDLGGLRPLELELVRLGLDDEERRSFLYLLALLVVDLLQEPLHARDQIGGVYRRRIAGGLEVAGDLLLRRNGDGDLRRRRRDVVVLLPAGAERRG